MSILPSVSAASHLWKTAHDKLVHSIKAYDDACTQFYACLSSARPSFHEDYSQFEWALSSIEAELQRFEIYRKVLENGLSCLKKARNLSYALAPINILPQSLLLSIFSYAIDSQRAKRTHLPLPSRRDQHDPALVLSSVCASWRNITLENPSLWSTILLDQEDPECQLAQILLARAGNASIDVQASFPDLKALESFEWHSLLQTRYDRIRSLDLVLPDISLLRIILVLWPWENLAPSLKALSVKIIRLHYMTDDTPEKVLPNRVHERFLQNLSTFSLYGGYFDWDSAAFTNLVNLQVARVTAPGPTLIQVVNMLKASPRLRTLCLMKLSILRDENIDHQPVYLEHLRKLSLVDLGNEALHGLIPLLLPGSQPLTLHLDYGPEDNSRIMLFSNLFRRSYVESLYIHNRTTREAMSHFFGALPHLGYLYVRGNNVLDILEALSTPFPASNRETSTSLLPCSRLHTLYFHKCEFKRTRQYSLRPITDRPSLIIKLQDFDPPLANFPRSKLAPGDVTIENVVLGLPQDVPFDGIDQVEL
ncbi:hypothetical protein FS749_003721 [Ceratobasidium sp. UAMH 11750]|nr:hypothetical protein FS749_003721 [Ceratobasidium sp. UAMH 11750]